NTGRYRDQWHTMTRTGLSATLSQHRREPLLEIHPDDGERFGIVDGGLAEVTTGYGRQAFRVLFEPGQRRGEVFAPMHWTDAMAGAGRTNRLAAPRVDPVSGQPGFKNTPAKVTAVTPEWRGFLVTTKFPESLGAGLSQPGAAPDQPHPRADSDILYWAKSRVTGGWLCELAGMGSVDAEALLPEGPRVEVSDAVRQMRRIAVSDSEGRLAAALYLTRSGTLPAREWIAAQLGGDEAGATELLAARPRTPQEETGALVCLCHGVGERRIAAAARGGADSVAAIGACTLAGTNCGSCRPAIARLLAAVEAEREAA
ncbi:MAG: molybdopterin dinucleotide binding domain-containing protein, partial [Novosphingobium sp.]